MGSAQRHLVGKPGLEVWELWTGVLSVNSFTVVCVVLCVVFSLFEVRSCITQPGLEFDSDQVKESLELLILLPPPVKYWEHRHTPTPLRTH